MPTEDQEGSQPLNPLATLDTALTAAGSEPDPSAAIDLLVQACRVQTRATTARLFLLDLARSVYHCKCQFGREDTPPELAIQAIHSGASSFLAQVIESRKPRIASPPPAGAAERGFARPEATARFLHPIVRGGACLGALDLDLDQGQGNGFVGHERSVTASIASALLLLIEKQRTLALLRSLQQPIDYHQKFSEFLRDLVLLISDASGMPFIVLRGKEEDSLRCVAQFGFPDSYDLRRLDLPLDCEPFDQVMATGTSCAVPALETSGYKKLQAQPRPFPVRSLVAVQIPVEAKLFGILAFGASCRYEFSPLEVAGLENIASTIGREIATYRHIHEAASGLIELTKAGAALTAVEVAQAARHEAIGHLDTVQKQLGLLDTLVSANRIDSVRLGALVAEASEEAKVIEQSLAKIAAISRPPDRERVRTPLHELWEAAFGNVLGRLEQERIEVHIGGPDVAIEGHRDLLVNAFLNLALNSIDAFREHGRKGGREITVRCLPVSGAARYVQMTYTDNAGGIDPSKLRGGEASADTAPVSDRIFKRGVTSKKGGHGFGLFLVRKILDDHSGSIDLVSHRGGVRFEIALALPT